MRGAYQYILIKYEWETKDLQNHKCQLPTEKEIIVGPQLHVWNYVQPMIHICATFYQTICCIYNDSICENQ